MAGRKMTDDEKIRKYSTVRSVHSRMNNVNSSQRLKLKFCVSLVDNVTVDTSDHREITLIELQSLVVFGCAALLFMVGATASTHDREEGWDDFLFVYTE